MISLVVVTKSKSTGKPLKGKRISVGCDELLTLWTTKRQSTDADGKVVFSVARSDFKGRIYLDGKVVFQGKVKAFNELYL